MTHNIQSVFYELLDQHNNIITSGSVEIDTNKPIDALKRAVYSANDTSLPSNCRYTHLHVYPPGTTDYSAQAVSAKTRIDQLLSTCQPDDSIILVARPPLSNCLHNIPSDVQQLSKQDDEFEYWSRLSQGIIKDNAIDLSPSTALGMENLPSKVYVRKHYEGIYNQMLKLSPKYRVIIRGTPGIGKSMFAVYLMYCHRDKGCIVYHPRNKDTLYVYNSGLTVYKCSKGSLWLDHWLRISTTLYIVDGAVPAYDSAVHCNCVMITSPNNKLENEYNKAAATPLIMPPWTLDELKDCCSLVYPNVELALVSELYDKWGGVPRYVLEFANNKIKQRDLKSALVQINVNALRDCVGQTAAPDTISHRLIHIMPSADYLTPTLVFASTYVAEQIVIRLIEHDKARMIEWINSSSGQTSVAALRGTMFERIGHTLLASGGTFDYRELNDNNSNDTVSLALASAEIKQFNQVSEINMSQHVHYYQPKYSNFSVVDSIKAPNNLFQFTVSQKHSIKATQLKELLTQLKMLDTQINLYFVVPPDVYDKFPRQKYVTTQGEDFKQQDQLWMQQVHQFVIRLHLNDIEHLTQPAAVEVDPDNEPMQL